MEKTLKRERKPHCYLEVVYDREINEHPDPHCFVRGKFYAPHYWISEYSFDVYALFPQFVEEAKTARHMAMACFHHEFDTEGEWEPCDFDELVFVISGL